MRLQSCKLEDLHSSLNKFLQLRKVWTREGHCGMSGRLGTMQDSLPMVCDCIGQTGFNVGHSALAFLHWRPEAHVVSFQLQHPAATKSASSVAAGKTFVDVTYPGRHELVLGRSATTLPVHKGPLFDCFFVDGGHSYKCALSDISFSRGLCTPGAIILCDDVRYPGAPLHEWEKGPSRAWRKAIQLGIIEAQGEINGLAWGRYQKLPLMEHAKSEIEDDDALRLAAGVDEDVTVQIVPFVAEEVALPLMPFVSGALGSFEALRRVTQDGYELEDFSRSIYTCTRSGWIN